MKLISKLLFIVGALTTAHTSAADVPIGAIEGRWGRDNCSSSIHTIQITQNKQFLRFKDEEKTYYYYLVGTTDRGYKVVMLNEERLDSAGNPVSWSIVFHNSRSFSWLRSDREPRDLRGPMVRC